MLSKILIFLIVIVAVYLIFFKFTKRADKGAKNFVECAKCGTFVEIDEAVLSGKKYICDECIKIDKKG